MGLSHEMPDEMSNSNFSICHKITFTVSAKKMIRHHDNQQSLNVMTFMLNPLFFAQNIN